MKGVRAARREVLDGLVVGDGVVVAHEREVEAPRELRLHQVPRRRDAVQDVRVVVQVGAEPAPHAGREERLDRHAHGPVHALLDGDVADGHLRGELVARGDVQSDVAGRHVEAGDADVVEVGEEDALAEVADDRRGAPGHVDPPVDPRGRALLLDLDGQRALGHEVGEVLRERVVLRRPSRRPSRSASSPWRRRRARSHRRAARGCRDRRRPRPR